jgi:hypothetical protein
MNISRSDYLELLKRQAKAPAIPQNRTKRAILATKGGCKPVNSLTPKKASKYQDQLFPLLKASNCPIPVLEYKFHPDRKWRFDFAWVKEKIAVEIEGGCWIKGRHNRGTGFIGDMSKYNNAVLLGWKVLRYTPQQIPTIPADITILSNSISPR